MFVEIEELNYVYQRIGFQCFSETLFEDAGKSFFEGNLDPRLLVSYFPDLRGTLFTADDSINVYAGVAARMPSEASVDDISKCLLFWLCVFPFSFPNSLSFLRSCRGTNHQSPRI